MISECHLRILLTCLARRMNKMLRTTRVLIAALGLVLLFGTGAFAEKTYINGIDANYPPFAYVDKNGEPAGFDVDSLK